MVHVLLLLKYLCGLRSEAVDVPVRLPVPVADGDGEPAEVCPNDADGAVQSRTVGRLAAHCHVLALATVVRLVEGAVGAATCKKKNNDKSSCYQKWGKWHHVANRLMGQVCIWRT